MKDESICILERHSCLETRNRKVRTNHQESPNQFLSLTSGISHLLFVQQLGQFLSLTSGIGHLLFVQKLGSLRPMNQISV